MENYRNIAKQIKELDLFEDEISIAFSLTEKSPELTVLSDEHIETIMWLNITLSLTNNKRLECGIIAEAIILGSQRIKNNIIEISTFYILKQRKYMLKSEKIPIFF